MDKNNLQMDLIGSGDIQKISRLNKLGSEVIGKLLLQVFRYNKLKKIYSKNYEKDGIEFISSVIKDMDISLEFNPDDLNKIPSTGPFITVSNHPLGGIDGLILIYLISKKRPDYKIFSNFLLHKIEPLHQHLFTINPFSSSAGPGQKIKGLKEALLHLKEGKPMGIFPALEASRFLPEKNLVSDGYWRYDAINFINKAKAPIIPIHFRGNKNSIIQFFRRIHPLMRTIKVQSELLNKKNKQIKITIGTPISVKEQGEIKDVYRFGRFLRLKTYSLGTSLEVKRHFKVMRFKKQSAIEPIIEPDPIDLLVDEINVLKEKHLLLKQKKYTVICAPTIEMPRTLNEIGRLREITFREVGEGTNQSTDLDEYDLYYHQLIIWDEEQNKIVGAYRMGKGQEIMEQYGAKGFYIESLFKIKNGFEPVLHESIELGRSFIVKEYQKEPMTLFLLWKGILFFLLKNPDYRYLIGPVSISNRYSTLSKVLIVEFIKANFYNYDLARFIEPRTKFKVQSNKDIDKEVMLEYTEKDIKKFDKFIKEVEPYYTMPVLLKKYLQQNAKIIGFNVDPAFNNCLDGLIILDLYDIPIETIESLTKEFEDNAELFARIYKNNGAMRRV
jgi:putative hemolysin